MIRYRWLIWSYWPLWPIRRFRSWWWTRRRRQQLLEEAIDLYGHGAVAHSRKLWDQQSISEQELMLTLQRYRKQGYTVGWPRRPLIHHTGEALE